MKFPKTLLVTQEKHGRDNPFFIAHENGLGGIDTNERGKPVASYKLVSVDTLDVTVVLTPIKRRKPGPKAKVRKKASKRTKR